MSGLPTAIDPVTPNSYRARKLSTLGSAITLTAPGVPMIFQGQEMLENQQFNSGRNVDWSKTNTYSYIVQFYHDLISARRNLQGLTPGLEGDRCTMLAVDNVNKLIAFNRWNSANPNQSAVVVGNFTSNTVNNYSLTFPSAGNWYVQLNSDSTTYGPDYGNIGSSMVTASGSPATGSITIGPYSALILSQISSHPGALHHANQHGADGVLAGYAAGLAVAKQFILDRWSAGLEPGSVFAISDQRNHPLHQCQFADRYGLLSAAKTVGQIRILPSVFPTTRWRKFHLPVAVLVS